MLLLIQETCNLLIYLYFIPVIYGGAFAHVFPKPRFRVKPRFRPAQMYKKYMNPRFGR